MIDQILVIMIALFSAMGSHICYPMLRKVELAKGVNMFPEITFFVTLVLSVTYPISVLTLHWVAGSSFPAIVDEAVIATPFLWGVTTGLYAALKLDNPFN